MSVQKFEGQCKLCKKRGQLTFEHVPPRTTFNDKSVKVLSGSELLDHVVSDKNPWELSQLHGRIQQKGKGGYYLCKDCNANAGSWYVPYYEEFIKGICSACSQESYENQGAVLIETGSFSPLPIIKQVLLMFLDINNIGFGDDELRNFITNKEKRTGFDSNKYKVYCFIVKGSIERICGFSVYMINTEFGIQYLGVTEIATAPIGFSLFVDKPTFYSPKGCEITSFADYKYGERVRGEILLPILDVNSSMPVDYRTKEEIEKTKQMNQQYLNNLGDYSTVI